MQRIALVLGAVVSLLAAGSATQAARAPVSLVGRIPTLGTGQAWRAVVRAPRKPVLRAAHAGRSLTFRTQRIAPRRYAATVRLAAPGRWLLSAQVGRVRHRLGSVRVVTRPYRLAVPSQLVANPDGSLLVAERAIRTQVTRIDPATGLVSTFATLPVEPYGLAWDGRRLLVTTHAGIYAVPAHGGKARLLDTADVGPVALAGSAAYYGNETQIGRIDLGSGATTPFPTSVTNPHTLAFDGSGRLLVADTGNGRVLSVDPASGAATTIASGLTTPIAMAPAADGSVLVAEHDTGRLLRIAGGAVTTLATGLRKPYAILVAPDGDYYVTEIGDLNSATGRLVRVTPAGQLSVVQLRR